MIEHDAHAAAEAGAEARGPDEDQRRNLRLDAQVVERKIRRIACWQPAAAGRAQADETGGDVQAATEFGQRGHTKLRLEMQPVADDDVWEATLRFEAIVMQRRGLLDG